MPITHILYQSVWQIMFLVQHRDQVKNVLATSNENIARTFHLLIGSLFASNILGTNQKSLICLFHVPVYILY